MDIIYEQQQMTKNDGVTPLKCLLNVKLFRMSIYAKEIRSFGCHYVAMFELMEFD